MGRRPGSKNKTQSKVEAPVTANEVSQETTTVTEESVNNSTLGYVGEPELDPERESIYDEYAQVNEPAAAVTEEVAEKPVEAKGEEEEEKKEEEETKTETSPEEEVAENKVEDVSETKTEEKKKEEIKTVPYDALHEEREKRKLAQAKAREFEERLKELEARLSSPPKPAEFAENEYLTEEERRLKELEDFRADILAKEQKEKARTAQQTLEKNIADTDAFLAEKGFPGFQFLAGRVGDELDRLVKEDPDNAVLNNPEGWKKIYVEKVFPTVKGLFAQIERQDVMDKKKAAKSGIALAGSPGATTKKEPATEKEYTYEDYLNDRIKNSL